MGIGKILTSFRVTLLLLLLTAPLCVSGNGCWEGQSLGEGVSGCRSAGIWDHVREVNIIQGHEWVRQMCVARQCREGWRAQEMDPGGCQGGTDVWEESSWWESMDSPSRGKLE